MKTNSSIILILLSIGLFYTYTDSQYSQVKDLRAVSSDYQKVLQDISSISETRDNLVVAYNNIPEENINLINKVLPDNIDTVRLALDLDTLASRFDISIESVMTDVGAKRPPGSIILPNNSISYDTATVSFKFVASYDDFINFLYDLERNLRITDIRSLTFRAEDGDLYEYTLVAETYWLK